MGPRVGDQSGLPGLANPCRPTFRVRTLLSLGCAGACAGGVAARSSGSSSGLAGGGRAVAQPLVTGLAKLHMRQLAVSIAIGGLEVANSPWACVGEMLPVLALSSFVQAASQSVRLIFMLDERWARLHRHPCWSRQIGCRGATPKEWHRLR